METGELTGSKQPMGTPSTKTGDPLTKKLKTTTASTPDAQASTSPDAQVSTSPDAQAQMTENLKIQLQRAFEDDNLITSQVENACKELMSRVTQLISNYQQQLQESEVSLKARNDELNSINNFAHTVGDATNETVSNATNETVIEKLQKYIKKLETTVKNMQAQTENTTTNLNRCQQIVDEASNYVREQTGKRRRTLNDVVSYMNNLHPPSAPGVEPASTPMVSTGGGRRRKHPFQTRRYRARPRTVGCRKCSHRHRQRSGRRQ